MSILTVPSDWARLYLEENLVSDLECVVCKNWKLDPVRYSSCAPSHSICTPCAIELSKSACDNVCPICRNCDGNWGKCLGSPSIVTTLMESKVCSWKGFGAQLIGHLEICDACTEAIQKITGETDDVFCVGNTYIPRVYIKPAPKRPLLYRYNPPPFPRQLEDENRFAATVSAQNRFETSSSVGMDSGSSDGMASGSSDGMASESEQSSVTSDASTVSVIHPPQRMSARAVRATGLPTSFDSLHGMCFMTGCVEEASELECGLCRSYYHLQPSFCYKHCAHVSHLRFMIDFANEIQKYE